MNFLGGLWRERKVQGGDSGGSHRADAGLELGERRVATR